jgi:hypothetical protein
MPGLSVRVGRGRRRIEVKMHYHANVQWILMIAGAVLLAVMVILKKF